MRKIEREMIEAIKARKYYSKDNTKVVPDDENIRTRIYLHDNEIAYIEDNELWISDCGYQTKTTKSLLNCLLNHFELPIIYSKNFQWYIGIEVWNGSTSYLIPQKESEEESINKCLNVLGIS